MSAPLGIYTRVSRQGEREEERFHSHKEQVERATGLVVAKGYTPGPVFTDNDVSGATPPEERPAMGELLRRIKAGELGGVAAYSLDRLSREPAHGDALVKAVTKAGGVVLTPDIPDAIDSPTGEFTFGMLLQVAKLYRSQAGARFASAKERAILAGIPVGPVPVGYRQRADRRLEPDPTMAPAVREVFERRANGEGYTPLANVLGAATGRTWSRQGVAAVIRNRFYATGRLEYGDVVSDVAYEPLVDEPLWHAAQGTETRRASRSEGAWLLTGLAKCAACGHSLAPVRGATRRRKDPRRGNMEWVAVRNPTRSYRCPNRACQARAHVKAAWLEGVVKRLTFERTAELATRGNEGPDLGPLEEALAAAERRLAQVLSPEAQDALGDAWAATAKARRTERDAAALALGEARRDAGGGPSVDMHLADVWDGLSGEDRRAALALYWKAIRVGRRVAAGIPLGLVPRGPHAEAEVTLP
jgi:DNA invertase Pin-like site-specific DNA recombinase